MGIPSSVSRAVRKVREDAKLGRKAKRLEKAIDSCSITRTDPSDANHVSRSSGALHSGSFSNSLSLARMFWQPAARSMRPGPVTAQSRANWQEWGLWTDHLALDLKTPLLSGGAYHCTLGHLLDIPRWIPKACNFTIGAAGQASDHITCFS